MYKTWHLPLEGVPERSPVDDGFCVLFVAPFWCQFPETFALMASMLDADAPLQVQTARSAVRVQLPSPSARFSVLQSLVAKLLRLGDDPATPAVALRVARFAFRDVATVRLSGIPLQEVIQASVHERPEGIPGFFARPLPNDGMPLSKGKQKDGLCASLGGLFDVATSVPRFTDMASARSTAVVFCAPAGLDDYHRNMMLNVAARYTLGPEHLRPLLVYLQIDRPDLADQAVPLAPPRALPEAVRDIFDVVNEEAAVLPADGPAVLANLAHFLQKRLDGEEGTLDLEDASIGWYEPIPPHLGGVDIRTPPNGGPDGGRTMWHFGQPS